MKGVGLVLLVMGIQFSLYGQPGSSCENPLPITCNKYMHIDQLFPGSLSDNGGLPCVNGFQEVAGIWLELNIGRKGVLAFELIPDNHNQDFDFAIFPATACDNLESIRCVSGGPSMMNDFWCIGVLGLRDEEFDINEHPGCISGQNNYCQSITVNEGERYLLYVHRFESTGGFGLTFDQLVLIESEGISNAVKIGYEKEEILFEYLDNNIEYNQIFWKLGDADTEVVYGSGPHRSNLGVLRILNWSVNISVNKSCNCEYSGQLASNDISNGLLKLWPNPCSEYFYIDVRDKNHTEPLLVQVIDNSGRIVKTATIGESDELLIPIEMSGLKSGVYLIRVIPGGEHYYIVKI